MREECELAYSLKCYTTSTEDQIGQMILSKRGVYGAIDCQGILEAIEKHHEATYIRDPRYCFDAAAEAAVQDYLALQAEESEQR